MIPCKLKATVVTLPPEPECSPDWDTIMYASHLTESVASLVQPPVVTNLTTVLNDEAYMSTSGGRFGGGALVSLDNTNNQGNDRLEIGGTGGLPIKLVSFWFKMTAPHVLNYGRGLLKLGSNNLMVYVKAGNVVTPENNYKLVLNASGNLITSYIPPLGTWLHFELNVTDKARVYIDGDLKGEVAAPAYYFYQQVHVGGTTTNQALGGYISDLEIGSAARHTENFIPPTEPFSEVQCP